MGVVAGALGVSHILLSPNGVEAEAEIAFAGYAEVGRRVRKRTPDLIVVISGDHMFNIDTGIQVPLGVGVGDQWVPYGDMGIPTNPRPGHRDFAEGLVHDLASAGFDIAKLESDGFRPDHGFCCPLLFADPEGSIPFVPIHININMDPVPSPARCHALGSQLRRYIIEKRPADERVVVLGTGGLSHWLMMEGHGTAAPDFDREVLDRFAAGRAAEYTSLTNAEILEKAGNGGLELNFWLAMAACAPGATGEEIFNQEVWGTTLAAMELAV